MNVRIGVGFHDRGEALVVLLAVVPGVCELPARESWVIELGSILLIWFEATNGVCLSPLESTEAVLVVRIIGFPGIPWEQFELGHATHLDRLVSARLQVTLRYSIVR